MKNYSTELKRAVVAAHRNAAQNPSASTAVFQVTFDATRSYTKSVAAALLTFGESHAPLNEIYRRFTQSEYSYLDFVVLRQRGQRMPGFGNSFVRECQTDDLQYLDWLLSHSPVYNYLNETRKNAFQFVQNADLPSHVCIPNIGLYTAVAASALGLTTDQMWNLALTGRLQAWAKMADDYRKRGQTNN